MDNQFRRGDRRSFYRGRQASRPASRSAESPKPKPQKDDDSLINLYDDLKNPKPGEPDPEVEELKKLAQSDLLKTYAWLRRKTAALSAKVRRLKTHLTERKLKTAKIGLAGLAVVLLAVNLIPATIDRFTGDSSILGTQVTADFDTLEPGSSQATNITYDEEVGVSVYKDTVGGVPVTVSQQVLPANLKSNPAELQKLAISLDNKTSINRHETQKGLIYIAETEEETNIVIFNHNDLLVFIRANGSAEDQVWIDYVNQLQ